jgi:hypothetical protein
MNAAYRSGKMQGATTVDGANNRCYIAPQILQF